MSKDKVKKKQDDFIKILKQMHDGKDLDAIADLFLQVIAIYGLKMDEVAALNYYITERTIKAKHNAEFIKDKLSLNVNELGPEGILKVQEALLDVYVGELAHQIGNTK